MGGKSVLMKHMRDVVNEGKSPTPPGPQNPQTILFPGCLPHLRASGVDAAKPDPSLHKIHCLTTSEANFQDPAITRIRTQEMLKNRRAALEKRRQDMAMSLEREKAMRQSASQAVPQATQRRMTAKEICEAYEGIPGRTFEWLSCHRSTYDETFKPRQTA
eukprot:CAMPEP_0205930052 /NCGR_PEP_ID=MMETSP1325-20131115/25663_1 /ASSEMBLY_ACC=CAM_ASM_000708 /TAXON_ID=236786 /ORGANISM="Florenciella sp., Strain RCC1007" /LENGTH=159 /DNA_ID=CAMNT_0053299361 /DNA_START=45 /DNA_END=524 /DNA_ORIENTATION=+